MSEIAVEPPKSLRSFCTRVVEKYSAQWPPDETKMAWEFVTYFGLPPIPGFEDYRSLASQLAIEVAVAPLPPNFTPRQEADRPRPTRC